MRPTAGPVVGALAPEPLGWRQQPWACAGPGPERVELQCLLPSGVYVALPAESSATLRDVKEDLWEAAAAKPLPGMLLDMSLYAFQYLSRAARLEDVDDENKRLRDLEPFCGILRIIRRHIKDAEENFNANISKLIGKGLHEFDSLKVTEVNEYRAQMRQLAEETAAARRDASWMELLEYQFPPRLANSPILPQTLINRRRVGADSFVLVSKFEKVDATFTFNVNYTSTPKQLLKNILAKKANATLINGDPADFILKVCGREEYLFGDYPLVQFLYIQETLSRDGVPHVVTLPISSLPIERNIYSVPHVPNRLGKLSFSTLTLRKKGKTVSSWNIKDDYSCSILGIQRLNTDLSKPGEVGVQAGLFHGGKSLCESKRIKERTVAPDGKAEFDKDDIITFPIKVYDIPRMARLCFVIYEVTKTAKGLKSRRMKDPNKEVYINPLAWVNTSVFDYKNKLKTDATTLYTWNYEDTLNDEILNPLGTTVAQPTTDSIALMIKCSDYNQEHPIVFPSDDVIRKYAEENENCANSTYSRMNLDAVSAERLNQLRLTAEKDPIYEMHEQDRKELWALREYFRNDQPTLLPKLLQCVEWNMKAEAAGAAALVNNWPMLSPAHALELLDYAYADRLVRRFAVSCLVNISDEDLSLYLLQLVQALKHETYYMCDLMEFLLRRALSNRKIGHYLFWHLRSEMKVPSVSIRFGLILEAYCRGSEDHVESLLKQTECLEKLIGASELVRMRRDSHKARTTLVEQLVQASLQEALSNVTSTLDPSYKFKTIKIDRCKVMDSKMRPLWLVFDNQDPFGSDISIILKNGDDLRQDMLALQMIKIMDKMWKDAGYDFRMNPYGCISMDHRVGMIEVVLEAETIANIQKEKGIFSATSPFKKGSLFNWLKDHNTTEESLNKAIEEFTLSCAGYCVATYVLGVADRHSDNIMVKKTGQLFHIDFGHILGHFKEKFGFRRERVPFVLTHDFVNVINKGQKDAKKGAAEFTKFQNNCEEAFMILRRHGYLFLSLFAMMISTGLPELSSEKDLAYLRETLVLDLPDHEALSHFRGKFEEALSNSWKTSLNWASHNMAKNNKQ